MSGPPEAGHAPGAHRGGDSPLSPDAVDAVLGDFRAWLLDLARVQTTEGRGQRSESQDRAGPTSDLRPATSDVDLATLVGQFTALRHEVNLQTKAARAAVEQNAEVLKQITARPEPAADPEALRPLLKAVIDIADALALSLRQMEKFRDSAGELIDLASGGCEPPEVRPRKGLLARLFGRHPAPANGAGDRAKQAADKLRQLAAAAADGYALSLRRVERVLPTFELEPISCTGKPFDAELMEVVEVVARPGVPAGTVVEEVRTGYRWRGKVLRFSQVKVSR